MRSRRMVVTGASVLACCLGACVTAGEPNGTHLAHHPVALPPAYASLPAPPPDEPLHRGLPVTLDARQQEIVVMSVTRWMKQPASARFGPMAGARNGNGAVTICGNVDGRADNGGYVGMKPYVGVLMGTPKAPEFVVVGIAGNGREAAQVASLCRESGVDGPG